LGVPPNDHSKDISTEDSPKPELENTTPPTKEETNFQDPCKEPQISLHALSDFSTPQTFNLIGYIRNYKVIVLIDNGRIQNFIRKRVDEETHCYVHPIPNFQIMISNKGMMKCGG
jgi:hypothetical protein